MKFTEKTTDEYANGLIKSCEHIILFIEKEISKIKDRPEEKNTISQVFTSGKLKSLNTVLNKVKQKRDNIIKRKIN